MGLFDNPIGKNFGPYKVLGKLGRGGMAAVFRAVHEPTDTVVALKVFTPPDGDTTEFFKRAKREVVALQMCSHTNILKVHGFDFESEAGYVAVEFVDGQNLQEISDKGKIALEPMVRIARDVAGALAYIHARGLFHRDLKPANIMVESSTSRSVLLDFGIVKATNLTQISGFQKEVMGTLAYMAPEQFLSREVDGRTDLYQLGLVLYRLATAGDPPPVMDLVERVDRPNAGPSLPVRTINPDLPEAMENLIANLTHPTPDGRYPTAHEVMKDLLKVQGGEPVAIRGVVASRRTAGSISGGVRATGSSKSLGGSTNTGATRQPSGSKGPSTITPRTTGRKPVIGNIGNVGGGAISNKPVSGQFPKPVLSRREPPATLGSSKGKLAAVAGVVALLIAIVVFLLRR